MIKNQAGLPLDSFLIKIPFKLHFFMIPYLIMLFSAYSLSNCQTRNLNRKFAYILITVSNSAI
jgi:hypothetical protein